MKLIPSKYSFVQDSSLMKDFAFFSANLQHFIPSISFDNHASLFERLCEQQVLISLEQETGCLPSDLLITIADESSFLEPSIIASFHTGSYRLISRYLAARGLPHMLVLSTDILNKQGERYREIMNKLYGYLERLLNRDCMQWENWFYVHNDMVLPVESIEISDFELNAQPQHSLPFKIGERFFVLDKKHYSAYQIGNDLYDGLLEQLVSF